jgi:hypothetical protein
MEFDANEAILIWLGGRDVAWPNVDDGAVLRRFGAKMAPIVLEKLRNLEVEFYESDACWRCSSLAEMGQLAIEDFRTRHPEISEKAASEFARRYVYDHK